MKFFSLLTFVAAVSATPMPSLELSTEQPKDLVAKDVFAEDLVAKDLVERQASLALVVLTTVQTVSNTIETSLDAITTAINTAGDNINIDVQAIIEANLNAISVALAQGTAAIAAAVAAAGGNIAAIVAGFGLAQVTQLIQATNQLVALLNNLSVQLTVIITGIRGIAPAVLDALRDEIAAIQAAIAPFTNPIGTIIAAVRRISVTFGLLLSGFDLLVPSLLSIIGGLLGGL